MITDDLASSPKMIRARVRLIAWERGLTARQVAPALKAASNLRSSLSTSAILRFARRHAVSTDWLLFGCLQGLRRMKQMALEEAL